VIRTIPQVQAHPILVKGKPLAEGRLPAICAPLVGRSREALLREAEAVAAKRPDLLEWRVDFFADIGDTAAVLDTATALREATRGIPLLFTRRSQREGGEPIGLSEPQVVALYRAVCEAGLCDLADFEMANGVQHIKALRECSRANGIGLVLSYHNFSQTPQLQELLSRFEQAESLDADVAKVAVMPHGPEDVLRLLEATLQASRARSIPVVSMAMAGWGALSRLAGGIFGSALTFAVGQNPSAPGQMAIEEVRAALEILRKARAC